MYIVLILKFNSIYFLFLSFKLIKIKIISPPIIKKCFFGNLRLFKYKNSNRNSNKD